MICKDKSVGTGRFPIWLMEPEPAIYPAFCIHSFSLKMFISIYLKSVDQPARDSPHPPDPVRLGFLIAVVERWFPALYPASFH
jgi:hypothetical protein